MQDDTTVDSAQEATDGSAPGAHTGVIDAGASDGQGPDEQKSEAPSLDRKLARENASWRKRVRDLEAQLKAREDADLSEQERAQRQMIELQEALESTRKQMRDTRLSATVAAEATKLGIVDVDAAARLLDTDSLDYDDATGWTGIPEALRDLTQERPWLVQTGTVPGQDANPANPARRRSRITREQLAAMSQSEIDQLHADGRWDEVMAALAER